MEIKYNASGIDKKTLVKAISEIIGETAKYLKAPTFAYQIGDWYRVTRYGNLEIFDRADSEEVENLIEELEKRGFTAPNMVELTLVGGSEKDEEDMDVGFSIGMPVSEISENPCSDEILDRFNKIVTAKQTLFQKALGVTRKLKTSLDGDDIWFDWFDDLIGEEQLNIYSEFIKGLYRMAENAKRINSTEKPIDNEKFAMRTFLNRLGFIGKEHKLLRKTLLKNLSGNSAFRYGIPEKR